MVQALIDGGADAYGTSDSGHTFLWIAANAGHPDILKVFIDNTNSDHLEVKCGVRSETALAVAAAGGNTDCVRVLLAAGAEVYGEDENGESPVRTHHGAACFEAQTI